MGEPLAPFQRHSEPSRLAAIDIHASKATLRQMVLEALVRAGSVGLTDEEIQEELHLDGSTQRPRRVELMRAGLVIRSGALRGTRSGRVATIWIASRGSES